MDDFLWYTDDDDDDDDDNFKSFIYIDRHLLGLGSSTSSYSKIE